MTQPFALPPLPEPQLSSADNWSESSEVMGEYDAKDYARAYGMACYEAALDRAARECAAYPRRHPGNDGDGFWAALECATVIRSLKAG